MPPYLSKLSINTSFETAERVFLNKSNREFYGPLVLSSARGDFSALPIASDDRRLSITCGLIGRWVSGNQKLRSRRGIEPGLPVHLRRKGRSSWRLRRRTRVSGSVLIRTGAPEPSPRGRRTRRGHVSIVGGGWLLYVQFNVAPSGRERKIERQG